ncbi:MAG: STAS domain-containing protein [Nitrospirae bacterium]|nr:STAS domain-containing protein [Nitrospirota bacterium]
MDFIINGTKKEGQLTLDEELTIQNAIEIRDSLLKAIGSVEHTVLDMKNVTAVDVSFLQIIVSALYTASTLKKNISIVNIAQSFMDVVEKSGFTHVVKTITDKAV